ncbi:MAG: hypothetical protein R6X25_05860 [Candidatus Krumholzibacteriia bacterium]
MRHRSAATGSRRGPSRDGFSLLEVIIAASLLLVVFFGLTQVYTRGRTQVDFEEERRKATAVLQSHIDAIRRDYSYDTLVSVPDTTYVVDGRTYEIAHNITLDTPDPHAATLELTVTWTSRKLSGVTFDRQMTTTTILGRALPVAP